MDVDATCGHVVSLRVAPIVGMHLESTLLPRLESKARVVKKRHDNRWLVLTAY